MNRTKFNHETTTDQVLENIDLKGKRILITGGSSGLGAESARALASKGAEVIITARNMDKVKSVIESIQSLTGNQQVYAEYLELGSFDSIKAFAESFEKRYRSLDILINNAGIMACPSGKTVDGYELQFGTNHLGHFLLTNLLVPLLKPGSRIVNLSSSGHQISPVVFDDIFFEKRKYDKWLAYGQSKTANILHAVGLDDRLKMNGIRAFAVHPGAILTDLARHFDEADREMMTSQMEEGVFRFKSVEAGAATQVYAATAPELEGKGGIYLSDCQVRQINDKDVGEQYLRSYAMDKELAHRLWNVSEKLLGNTSSPGKL